MDQHGEIEEEAIAEFTLTDEDMLIILKSLDLYGYAMVMSENVVELIRVKAIAMKILSHLPKPELNS
jgi:hypothetical protein